MPSLSILPSLTGATPEWWATLGRVYIPSRRGTNRQARRESGRRTELAASSHDHISSSKISQAGFICILYMRKLRLEKSSKFSKFTQIECEWESQTEAFWCQSLCFSLRKWDQESEDSFNLCFKLKRPGKEPNWKSMLVVHPKFLPDILLGHQYITTNF